VLSSLLHVWSSLLDLVFPPKCINCKAHGFWICQKCFDNIEFINTPICYKCSKLSQGFKVCYSCQKQSGLKRAIVCTYWQEPIKLFIHYYKYKRLYVLKKKFGALMAAAFFKVCSHKNIVLVPVPLHKYRLWDRGFNQSALLAYEIAKLLDVRVVNCLVRCKHTRPQFGLSKTMRPINIKGAFRFKNKHFLEITGKTVVLVDDIVATGSTLQECARTLKKAGIKDIWSLVLAKA